MKNLSKKVSTELPPAGKREMSSCNDIIKEEYRCDDNTKRDKLVQESVMPSQNEHCASYNNIPNSCTPNRIEATPSHFLNEEKPKLVSDGEKQAKSVHLNIKSENLDVNAEESSKQTIEPEYKTTTNSKI